MKKLVLKQVYEGLDAIAYYSDRGVEKIIVLDEEGLPVDFDNDVLEDIAYLAEDRLYSEDENEEYE